MSPVSFTVSSIQGMWFLTWRRVPQNPQLGSVPLIPIIICFRVLEDTLDSRHIALVPSLNHVWLFKTIACQAPLSSKISWSLLKFMSIGSMILSKMSSSVVPFSSCPPSFPASGSFPMSWLFASGGQITGASAYLLEIIIFDMGRRCPFSWYYQMLYSLLKPNTCCVHDNDFDSFIYPLNRCLLSFYYMTSACVLLSIWW